MYRYCCRYNQATQKPVAVMGITANEVVQAAKPVDIPHDAAALPVTAVNESDGATRGDGNRKASSSNEQTYAGRLRLEAMVDSREANMLKKLQVCISDFVAKFKSGNFSTL